MPPLSNTEASVMTRTSMTGATYTSELDRRMPVARNNAPPIDRDREDMARLGKRQELRRNFGFLSMVGFSSTLMVTWEGTFLIFYYGLLNGGPAALVYGFVFCWAGYLALVVSLAEMVSIAPTAGGQYHWTFIFAPASYRKFLSFINGWQEAFSWLSCMGTNTYLCGTVVQGLLVLNHPGYKLHQWHTTLLLYAFLALNVFVNTFLAKHLPIVEGGVLWLHVVGFFTVLIFIVYLTPHKSAKEVFTVYLGHGGYDQGLSFFVGLNTSIFAFTGAGGIVHMAEEIKNASTIVPYALITSNILNGVLGFAMVLVILFCIDNLVDPVNSTSDYPYVENLVSTTVTPFATSVIASILLSLMFFCAVANLAASSRVIWALGRDNALPGAKYIRRVNPRTKLPLYAIGVACCFTLLIGIINLGTASTYAALTTLVVSGTLYSYAIPIGLLLWNRIKNPSAIYYGPFRLGRWGIPINIATLVFIVLVSVFSFFPSKATDLTTQTMNWSSVIWGTVMVCGVVVYFAYMKGRYLGPISVKPDDPIDAHKISRD